MTVSRICCGAGGRHPRIDVADPWQMSGEFSVTLDVRDRRTRARPAVCDRNGVGSDRSSAQMAPKTRADRNTNVAETSNMSMVRVRAMVSSRRSFGDAPRGAPLSRARLGPHDPLGRRSRRPGAAFFGGDLEG